MPLLRRLSLPHRRCADFELLQAAGTNLYKPYQDVASIGRVIGVPHFLTVESVEEQKEDAAEYRKTKKLDDDGQALKMAEIRAVRRMQAQFSGCMLRRTTNSVDWKGSSLLDLPPHKAIVGVLELTKREMDIIQKRAEDARSRQASAFCPNSHLTSPSASLQRTNQVDFFKPGCDSLARP